MPPNPDSNGKEAIQQTLGRDVPSEQWIDFLAWLEQGARSDNDQELLAAIRDRRLEQQMVGNCPRSPLF